MSELQLLNCQNFTVARGTCTSMCTCEYRVCAMCIHDTTYNYMVSKPCKVTQITGHDSVTQSLCYGQLLKHNIFLDVTIKTSHGRQACTQVLASTVQEHWHSQNSVI